MQNRLYFRSVSVLEARISTPTLCGSDARNTERHRACKVNVPLASLCFCGCSLYSHWLICMTNGYKPTDDVDDGSLLLPIGSVMNSISLISNRFHSVGIDRGHWWTNLVVVLLMMMIGIVPEQRQQQQQRGPLIGCSRMKSIISPPVAVVSIWENWRRCPRDGELYVLRK